MRVFVTFSCSADYHSVFSGRWLFITLWEFGVSIFNVEVISTLKMGVICFFRKVST